MASEKAEPVKILSKSEQNKSIRRVQRPKKNVIKNSLESPFLLEWPSFNIADQEEITNLLQKCCSGLKKIANKPPWKIIQAKKKGKERKDFLKDFQDSFIASLTPEQKLQNEERKKAVSHLIFGYNAVMKALERNKLVGIIVKKNVQPTFINKAFLPACAIKGVPLIPIPDLEKLLQSEDSLALPHPCLAMGLKPSVKAPDNRFHPLFVKMCQALKIDPDDMGESEEEEMEEGKENVKVNTSSRMSQSSHVLTPEQLQKYHLKRVDPRKRVFVPGSSVKEQKETQILKSDFISFGSDEETLETSDQKPKKQALKKVMDDAMNQKIDVALASMEFGDMFQIDPEGSPEDAAVKEELDKQDISQPKLKRKTKTPVQEYVTAKAKRLKGNPNRKTLKK